MKQGELTRSGKRRSPGGKRIFAALLALAMVVALLPSAALAAAPTEVWVGSTEVTSGYATAQTLYGGTVRYSGGVLYLSNNVTVPYSASHNNAAIYADGDLTIELTGTNTVTGPNASDNSCGIFVNGRLAVRGTGRLNANGGSGSVTNGKSYGVYIDANGAISVTGGTLSGTGGSAYSESYGVYIAGNGAISVTGGTLSGTGGAARSVSAGVYACNESSTTVSGSGTLTGNGAGGDISASTGVQVNGSVTVSGSGTLTGTGSGAYGQSHGLKVLGSGNLTVTGGSVTGVGGAANSTSGAASFGVYVLNTVAVSGGSLTAKGGTSGNSYGMDIGASGKIVLTGGNTLAVGGTKALSNAPTFKDTTQTNDKWYQWKSNTDTSEPLTGFILSSVQAYIWSATDKYLNVQPAPFKPVITTQPASQTVAVGKSATFTVVATGNPAPSYFWEYDSGSGWTDLGSATNSSYTVSAADMSSNGFQYRCKLSNSEGDVWSDAATLTVVAAANVSVMTLPAAAFVQGNAPELTVTVNAASVSGFDATHNFDGIDGSSQLRPNVGTVGSPGADGKVEDGSIKLTLNQSYLNTLAPGTHSLHIKLTGNPALPAYAQAYITVTAPGGVGGDDAAVDVPKTGDGATPFLWAGLVLLAGAGLIALRRRRRA